MAQGGSNQPPVLVLWRRKKGGGHAGHHGGAWKVAYADFVTAMMAFFLLLWLLNVTTSDQKRIIADYFAPPSVSSSPSGSGGVLGGMTITAQGAMPQSASPLGPPNPAHPSPTTPEGDPDETGGQGDQSNIGAGTNPNVGAGTNPNIGAGTNPNVGAGNSAVASDAALNEALAQKEQQQFQEAAQQLRDAVAGNKDLAKLGDSLLIDQTTEGLRIQIVDQATYSMFPLGSAQMYPQTRQLLGLVAQAVAKLPERLSISGHTDSLSYASDKYGNWELSTDRANASRRVLESSGIGADRIARIVGRADREPLLPNDPGSPRNRRISIILLRAAKITPAPTTGTGVLPPSITGAPAPHEGAALR